MAVSEPLPAGRSIQDAYLHRVDALPDEARRGLLLVAAATEERLEPIAGALAELGLDVSGLQSAEDAKLLVVGDGHARFRHPLVRSAVYHAATGSERRAAHAALAAALERLGDPDRAARHLASAALGPDEAVAAGSQQPEHAPASALPSLPLRTPSGRQRAFPRTPRSRGAARGRCRVGVGRRGGHSRDGARRRGPRGIQRPEALRARAGAAGTDGAASGQPGRRSRTVREGRRTHGDGGTASRVERAHVHRLQLSLRRTDRGGAGRRASRPRARGRRRERGGPAGPTTCSGGRSCWRARSTGRSAAPANRHLRLRRRGSPRGRSWPLLRPP